MLNLKDEKIVHLLREIADEGGAPTNTRLLTTYVPMTRKQYYTRMAALKRSGMISRRRAVYRITSFGIVMLHAINLMQKAREQKWKLEALDSAPSIHKEKLFDELITDPILKEVLR